MRLTMRTNLAMRVLMACAVNDGYLVRRAGIAEVANASENHLAQVVHLLAAEGFIETTRGRAGGLVLARRADEISIGDVFRTFEAGVPFAECFADEENTCPLVATCRLKLALESALAAFYEVLDAVTLDDLVRGNTGLDTLLRLHAPADPAAVGCAQAPSPPPH